MIRRLVIAAGRAIAASVVLTGSVAAQTGVLSGVIYDQTNKTGLAGAEVRITGTALVAISGRDGRFTIADIPVGTRELETVRAGYRPYRLPSVKIAAADTVHVYLALSAAPVESAPVEVTTASGGVGVLDGVAVKVRRTTSVGEVSENAPLYIIDGVLMAKGSIPLNLDPDAILTVEVIKGAAAESLYGSRAANGVIMITTRRNPD